MTWWEITWSLSADVLSGYNATIFAYGQTSSGKTHTMEVYRIVRVCVCGMFKVLRVLTIQPSDVPTPPTHHSFCSRRCECVSSNTITILCSVIQMYSTQKTVKDPFVCVNGSHVTHDTCQVICLSLSLPPSLSGGFGKLRPSRDNSQNRGRHLRTHIRHGRQS